MIDTIILILGSIIGVFCVIAGILMWGGIVIMLLLGTFEFLLKQTKRFCEWALMKIRAQDLF